jgi:hypothetical protein
MARLNKRHVLDAAYDDADAHLPERVIVTLKPGWAFSSGSHVRGFDTHAEANARLSILERCGCPRCTKRGS